MKLIFKSILYVIKLAASMLAPILFISNFWICEVFYPNSESGWEVYIPLDLLSHNFWACILFLYAICGSIPTKYKIGDLFIYFGVFLCFFDVFDRHIWHIYDFTKLDIVFTIPASLILASLLYAYVNHYQDRKSNK